MTIIREAVDANYAQLVLRSPKCQDNVRHSPVCLPAILYLLSHVYAHLDKLTCNVGIMFFELLQGFQASSTGDKLTVMQVDASLVTWIVC